MFTVYILALMFLGAYVCRFLFLCGRFLYFRLAADPATGRIGQLLSSAPDKNHTSGSLLNTYAFRISSASGISDSVYLDHIDPNKQPSVSEGEIIPVRYCEKTGKYLPIQKAKKDISISASVVVVSLLVIVGVVFVSEFLLPRFFASWAYILH